MPLPHFNNFHNTTNQNSIKNREHNEKELCKRLLELLDMDDNILNEKDSHIRIYRELKLRLLLT
jgi:hypothetical protein